MAKKQGGFFNGGFSRLFLGAEIEDPKREEEQKLINKQTLVAVENDEAADLIDITHYYTGAYLNTQALQTQADLINEYRMMALHPEVDRAIDDTINEAITADADNPAVVLEIKTGSDLSDSIKKKIQAEFDHIVELLNLEERAYEIFRQWYVDGRLYYHKIIDPNNTKKGILKVVNLDPRAIKKIKEVYSEMDPESHIERITDTRSYYLYDPTYMNAASNGDSASARTSVNRAARQALELSTDSVAFIHSGILTGDNNNTVLSQLEKARRPLNNLRMLEDAVVIYRITRAPERRIFYVDVGSLPKKGAEEYMQSLINRYKTKLVYDASTGKVKGNSHQVSMMEDYWLPRREGGRGTEIDTLPAGENLGNIEDLLFFQKNLMRALNVPESRLQSEATISIGNHMAEITRDEWKFNKFVQRLRRRFNGLFLDLLRTQLILKGITTADDWDELVRPALKFVYTSDEFIQEQQEMELMNNRIAALTAADPFVGKYYSAETVKRKILRQTDEQIEAEKKQMAKEIKEGLYPSPMDQFQMDNNVHPDQIDAQMDLEAARAKNRPKPPAN